MKQEDFDFIVKLLKDRSGIVINSDKTYLLESRLMPLARKTNFATIDDLIMALRGNNEVLIKQVVDAMTTNESFFFRDIKPFDQFRDMILPYLMRTRATQKSFRIWSAACSSGQEAYSLCMLLKEKEKELKDWKIEIVGTDLSSEILRKAIDGLYSQFEVQRGLPIQFLVKHFQKDGEQWRISKEIKDMVTFKEWNLMNDLKPLGVFDVIFCRNVLIYFDQADKTKILEKISGISTKDAFLYLGGAETVLGVTDKFKSIAGKRGVYISSTVGNDVIAQLIGEPGAAATVAAPATTASVPPPSTQPSSNPAVSTPVARPAATASPAQSAFVSRPAAATTAAKPAVTTATPATTSAFASRSTATATTARTATMTTVARPAVTAPATSITRPAVAPALGTTSAFASRPAATATPAPATTRPATMTTTAAARSASVTMGTASSPATPALSSRPTTTIPNTGTATRPVTTATAPRQSSSAFAVKPAATPTPTEATTSSPAPVAPKPTVAPAPTPAPTTTEN